MAWLAAHLGVVVLGDGSSKMMRAEVMTRVVLEGIPPVGGGNGRRRTTTLTTTIIITSK
jgi:hypothetical protein